MAERPHWFQYGPAIVISRDGSRALEIVEYLGREPHPQRDASYSVFSTRIDGKHDIHLVHILVDEQLPGVPRAIDERLNSKRTSEWDRVHLAEARLGEYLDEVGVPDFSSLGGVIPNIQLEPERLHRWSEADRATDDEIEAYLQYKCLWAWRFNHHTVTINAADFIRLGTNGNNVRRLVEFGRGKEWLVNDANDYWSKISGTEKLLRKLRSNRAARVDRVPRQVTVERLYVDKSRITELQRISSTFDVSKLVALCTELNTCWRGGAVHAVAALVRSIIDHVPPIFQVKTFGEVANNYPGSKSFKDSMQHLAVSARKIGDAHLHTQIRRSEVLPTPTQVDFSRDLDVLLAEIVRILK